MLKNKTAVGGFTLASIALFIGGLLFLGGNSMNDLQEYPLYFTSSVAGLSKGAPVVMRGVPLGEVTSIGLVANANKSNVTIPVRISIDPTRLESASGEPIKDGRAAIQDMVQQGMKAKLEIGSLITGQMRVSLDFYPETEIKRYSSDPYEIPTRDSPMSTIQKTLEKVPVEQLIYSVQSALNRINSFLSSGQIERAICEMGDTFEKTSNLLDGFQGVPQDLSATLKEIRALSHTLNEKIPMLGGDVKNAVATFTALSAQMQDLVQNLAQTTKPNSPVRREFSVLMEEVQGTAKAIKDLASSIERNPDVLLRGRKGDY